MLHNEDVVLINKELSLPESACNCNKKVQEGNDQDKAQSDKDSHTKYRGAKKPN